MPAYFKWQNFKGFCRFFLSNSVMVQHKKKHKTIFAKGLRGSSVMFHSGVSTSPVYLLLNL